MGSKGRPVRLAVLAAGAVMLILAALWLFVRHGGGPRLATTEESRARPECPEEEIVWETLVNAEGRHGGRLDFLSWGPHMGRAEIDRRLRSLGLNPAAETGAEALIRVRFRGRDPERAEDGGEVAPGPFGEMGEAPPDEIAVRDRVYLVGWNGKFIAPECAGSPSWKDRWGEAHATPASRERRRPK